LNALSGDSERPREPEIDLLYPVLVYRARRDQGNLDSAVRSGRQVANERRHDLGVGKRRGRGVHDAGQVLVRRCHLEIVGQREGSGKLSCVDADQGGTTSQYSVVGGVLGSVVL